MMSDDRSPVPGWMDTEQFEMFVDLFDAHEDFYRKAFDAAEGATSLKTGESVQALCEKRVRTSQRYWQAMIDALDANRFDRFCTLVFSWACYMAPRPCPEPEHGVYIWRDEDGRFRFDGVMIEVPFTRQRSVALSGETHAMMFDYIDQNTLDDEREDWLALYSEDRRP